MSDKTDEVEEWKLASGLVCGGDPDGITPAIAKKYWEAVEAECERLRAENTELKRRIRELVERWEDRQMESAYMNKLDPDVS